MKIERAESKFQPVVITLESQEEVDCLLICLNTTEDDFQRNSTTIDLIDTCQVKEASKHFGILYNQIEDIY